VREHDPSKKFPIQHLGVFTHNPDKTKHLVNLAVTLESGRRAACDIGDADPERMCPPRVEEYIRDLFAGSSVKVQVIKDRQQIAKEYPLFEAVDRAASEVKRHQGRIVYLDYTPSDPSKIQETLFFVGKGVTYDTGGADIKINGCMVGMSRDKCGAAAVVGFMEVVKLLKPEHVRVVAGLSLVRNSVGPNSYVADEVIVARSGARVRVVNTDAEGRMVMADVLCKVITQFGLPTLPHNSTQLFFFSIKSIIIETITIFVWNKTEQVSQIFPQDFLRFCRGVEGQCHGKIIRCATGKSLFISAP
jgi:leucyl aminopeptidase